MFAMEGYPKDNLKTPLSSSEIALYDADADDVIKQKRELTTNLHTKPRVSQMQVLDVKRSTPVIWEEIIKLEPKILTFHPDGLRIQPKIYMGLQRAGMTYLNHWLDENHISVSPTGMLICRALATYKRFLTYDELFTFLQLENCGGLQADIPQTTLTAPKKVIEERDIDWLMQSQKLSREQAIAQLERKTTC